jgi:hypothetical protein
MKKISWIVVAVISAGVATSAQAAWTNIGRVDFSYGVDKDTAYGNFGGPATALQFTARGSDVRCNYVRVALGNGTTANIFNGMLPQGKSVRVDLPGDRRNINKLAFECRAFVRGGAHIDIDADVDAYRDQWRGNPIWAKLWAAVQPPPPSMPANNWVPIGTERFIGPVDRNTAFAGWGGRKISQLALKPLDADAQCKKVSATFGNGNTRDLDLNKGGVAVRGRLYKIDLPGDARNVVKLNMVCRAIGASAVTIQIYGNQ